MNTLKQHFLILLFFAASLTTFAQVGVGTTSPEGVLDVVSSDSGIILTRVANTAAVTSPVNGMLIYDIADTCTKGYQNGAWSDCLTSTDNLGNHTATQNLILGTNAILDINTETGMTDQILTSTGTGGVAWNSLSVILPVATLGISPYSGARTLGTDVSISTDFALRSISGDYLDILVDGDRATNQIDVGGVNRGFFFNVGSPGESASPGKVLFTFEFNGPITLSRIIWYGSGGFSGGFGVSGDVQSSADGTTWTTVGTFTSFRPSIAGTITEINETTTRYLRLVPTSGAVDSGPYTREIEFDRLYEIPITLN